jgi:leucyl aminopeptidase (aminopeptidase T)
MSFFETFFESEEEEKKRLELERRMRRRAEEAAEAAGLEELPTVIDHNAEGHARADAAEDAVAEERKEAKYAAREAARVAAAARAAEIAKAEAEYAADIAAEIPEAQKARKLLTEYWKKMNEYKAKHMTPDGFLPRKYNEGRPNQNWDEVRGACEAAAAAYRYKYPNDSKDWRERELCKKKWDEYDLHSSRVFFTMRDYDREKGLFNLQRNSWTMPPLSGGKKMKSKYSRKSKSKYSRKSKSRYSRKSKSRY